MPVRAIVPKFGDVKSKEFLVVGSMSFDFHHRKRASIAIVGLSVLQMI